MENDKRSHNYPANNSSSGTVIPTNKELFDIFNQFLLRWTGLRSHRIVSMENHATSLPQGWELMFVQPLLGILVIRTTQDFEAKVEEWVTGRQLKESKNELLQEMLVLFWWHFASMFWGLETRKTKSSLFKKLVSSELPERTPDALCLVNIAGQPLEIRLWVPVSEIEMLGAYIGGSCA